MTEQKIPPLCLALVLSDAIWVDPATGKRTILGTFSSIFSNEFPATHAIMAIHCALTDGYGKTEVIIRLVDADGENDPLFEGKTEVQFEDPRVVAEMDFHFAQIVFPKAGEYRFQLFGAGELLMERRLVVMQIGEESESQ